MKKVLVLQHGDLGACDWSAFGGLVSAPSGMSVLRVPVSDDVDTGGGFQGINQVGNPLLIDLCLGNHAHRLRRFFRGQGKAGGGAHGRGGVGVAVFGAGGTVFAGYVDGLQLGSLFEPRRCSVFC